MPRKPVVSRTMQLLQVMTLRTDTVKEKIKHESFFLAGSYKNNEAILQAIRQLHDDDRMITSRIKSVTPVTAFVSQSIQAFVENAEEINILKE